jgi:hypothetical protein
MTVGPGWSHRSIDFAWDRCISLRRARKAALQRQPGFPGGERGSEPSQAYRQDLKQRDDAIYMNL